MQISVKDSINVALLFFMEVTRHVQSKVSQLLLRSMAMQNMFYVGSVMFTFTFWEKNRIAYQKLQNYRLFKGNISKSWE